MIIGGSHFFCHIHHASVATELKLHNMQIHNTMAVFYNVLLNIAIIVCYSICHQDLSSRSFMSVSGMCWTNLSHTQSDRNVPKASVCRVAVHIILWKDVTATREYCCHGRVYLVYKNV